MAEGQTPSSQIFPPLPPGFQEPFWYGSLQSFWLYYRVEPELLRRRLPDLPDGDRLEVALFDFGGGDLAGLASLDLQRYTGQGPTYLETTDEIEFNVYVYPQVREPGVPLTTWQDYLLGQEQTKTIGGYRLHVPCDNAVAVSAGRSLYGEPKYLAVFDCDVPSLNGPPSASWRYHVFQDLGDPPDPPNPHTPVKGPLIYGLECDLGGAPSVPANPSPLIEYGVVSTADGVPRVVANYWDFYGSPFDTYVVDAADPPWRVELTLGTEPDPTGTLDDVRLLIGHSQPVAAQVYTSAPVSAESRGWFLAPAPAATATASSRAPTDSFVALSAALTGFRAVDLRGTGQADEYLSELIAVVGDGIVARLLAAADEALGAPDPAAALEQLVLSDPDLGPVARNLIVLWYLGQWTPLSSEWRNRNGASPLDVERVISASAYRSGLVWRAIGAHPMGADPPGYGSWANPPADPGAD